MIIFNLLLVFAYVGVLTAAPAPTKKPSPSPEIQGKVEGVGNTEPVNTGLFYDKYLQDVIKLLESNKEFKEKMEKMDFEDIKDGKLSHEIKFFPDGIREKLNTLKRQEVSRLRKVVQAKSDLDNGRKVKKTHRLNEIANHLDHKNPHTFEADDLTNLIKAATSDLQNYDKGRHEDFKKYEMERELRRQERMKKLNDLERAKAEEAYLKHQKEVVANNQVHHPGSKEQLEEVWREEDGLQNQPFEPVTFFHLHDMNGDEMWDALEMEALFEKDLSSLYNSSDPDYDVMQVEEERRRMREHLMDEVDKDKDGLVSLDEFVAYSKTDEFEKPDENSYQTIDQLLMEHTLFTNDELERYREEIQEQEKEIREKLNRLKEETKELSNERKELEQDKSLAAKHGVEEHRKEEFESRIVNIKEREEEVKMMHKDLQEHSKDLSEMKVQLKKHEEGGKAVEKIKEKLDNLPPGDEKLKAVENAHKELSEIKKKQGVDHNDEKEEEHHQEKEKKD